MSDLSPEPEVAARQQPLKSYLKKMTVEPVLFLCIASAVIKFVILPQFMLNSICQRDFSTSVCSNLTSPANTGKQAQVQSTTAKWMLALYSVSLSISLCTVPLLGSFADAFGSKSALLFQLVMFDLQSITYVVLSWKSVQPAYLFICISLGGLSGDIVGVTMLTCSYLSRITTEEDRTFRLTLLDGIISLSLCIFTFISGFVITAFGFSASYLFSFGFDTIALLWLIILVKNDVVGQKSENDKEEQLKDSANDKDKDIETDTSQNRVHETSKQTSMSRLRSSLNEFHPVKHFKQLNVILREQGDSRVILALLTALFLSTICLVGESLILVLYITNQPYNMSPVDVGYLLSLQGLLRFVAGGVILNVLIQRFLKWSDINIGMAFFGLGSIYFILLGSATSSQMLFGIQILNIFGPLVSPTLRSVVTKKGGPQNYGTILSVALSMDAVASIVATVIVHTTYSSLVVQSPGAFCYILAAISCLGILPSFLAKRLSKDSGEDSAIK
ncbi:proton-coupled folate transporter-like isoform X2 [Rhopilema esculentum]|eukprot:gene4962-21308_t